MKNYSAIIGKVRKATKVLSISPLDEDHRSLLEILRQRSPTPDAPASDWKLYTSPTLKSGIRMLSRNTIPIAICERDLQPGTWKDLLAKAALMRHSPLVIVTSRLADERLWSEVLNLGGYDVLAKPFDATEVIRIIESAWRHWRDHYQSLVFHALRAAS